MATIPLSAARGAILDIVTICKADHWLDDVLPRFAALVDANCSGTVRRHLLLLTAPETPAEDEGRLAAALLARGWYSVVCESPTDEQAGRRLLLFDSLRARLPGTFGLRECLYMDPDTDVVADLQGIQSIAPDADLLWVANPLCLEPVVADLRRHGLEPAGGAAPPVLMEPGFLYLRRDLDGEFAAAAARHPEVNEFVPGSSYWNFVMRALGPRAVRLPDEFNRTFWDVPAAATRARTVHYTGQWKHLRPHVEYDRPARRIVIRPERVPDPPAPGGRLPGALAVVALFRDAADYLPHAFSRFEAWERAGLPLRYYFLENDSTDDTAAQLTAFMAGRRGRLESRRLAIHYDPRRGGEHHDRIMPLARMRSFIADVAMADQPAGVNEWTLLLDSDIYFPADVLGRMFAERARDPRPESIGMLTCYTQQLFHAERIPGAAAPCPLLPGWAIADHYFDTYAFHDSLHRHPHPACAFARCRRCRPGTDPASLPGLIPRDRPIVDVAAAFGGLALVPTTILRDGRIRWSTYGSGPDRSRVLAEHVLFCDRLRTITGSRVVVLQDVDCVYRL